MRRCTQQGYPGRTRARTDPRGQHAHQAGGVEHGVVHGVAAAQDVHQQGVGVLHVGEHGRHGVPQPAGAVRDLPAWHDRLVSGTGRWSRRSGGGGPWQWWAAEFWVSQDCELAGGEGVGAVRFCYL